MLLGGLVASRFGLWLFDLAVSQMLQEWVTPEELGKLLSQAVQSTHASSTVTQTRREWGVTEEQDNLLCCHSYVIQHAVCVCPIPQA